MKRIRTKRLELSKDSIRQLSVGDLTKVVAAAASKTMICSQGCNT